MKRSDRRRRRATGPYRLGPPDHALAGAASASPELPPAYRAPASARQVRRATLETCHGGLCR